MNKYAMPVDPRVLKKDFESDTSVDLNQLLTAIKRLKSLSLKEAPPFMLRFVNNAWWTLWKQIDSKVGINLRDREKLAPHFELMGKLIKMKPLKAAYRGVRLSSYEPNLLSETYPNIKKDEVIKNPKDPKVLAHLESLAYGLRSWSESKNIAANWAKGLVGMKTPSTRDKVVFVYKNPHVLFDVSKYWITLDKHQPEETERWDYQNRFPFDNGEQIIFVKNPIIKAISFKKGIWFVLIED